MTIDMKNYMGANESLAATEQELQTNSFQRESLDEGYPTPPPMEQETSVENEILPQEEIAVKEEHQEHNFRALTESIEKLKADREAEKKEYQLQLDMLRANLSKSQQPEAPKAKKMFDGMEDSDVPNVGELRKAWGERESAYNEKLEELQVANMHPDYAEVLGKYGKHLAETDPVFLQGLRGAENKALFAYQYAKKEQRIQQLEEAMKNTPASTPSQQSINAQKIVENSRKPGTLSQAGGQGALSKKDYYETMSDQEFMKMANKHMETI